MAKSHDIVYLDNLRITATLAVVLLHMSSVCLNRFCSPDATVSAYVLTFINVLTRFAVPVFVMITGTLLLHPRRVITYGNVWGKYVWRMVLVLLSIGWFYALLDVGYTHRAVSPWLLAKACANVLTGTNMWDHMWYVYMLIGLYLILPVLKGFVNGSTRSDQVKCALLMALCLIVLPRIDPCTGMRPCIYIPISSVFVLYLLLGHLFAGIGGERRGVAGWVGLACLGVALCAIGTGMYILGPVPATAETLSGDSLIVVLLACGMFLLFRGSKALDRVTVLGREIGAMVSDTSFGIYMFHPLFMNILTKVLHVNFMRMGLFSFLFITVVVIAMSMLTTLLFRKIPYLGKII